jgi:ornithine lipid ester-linked acyl 2-hydroxylase
MMMSRIQWWWCNCRCYYYYYYYCCCYGLLCCSLLSGRRMEVVGFQPLQQRVQVQQQQQVLQPLYRRHTYSVHYRYHHHTRICATKGFGERSVSKKVSTKTAPKNRLLDSLQDKPKPPKQRDTSNERTTDATATNKPYIKAEQDKLLDDLAYTSSRTAIGRVVAEFVGDQTQKRDPFWELIPSLITSKFPNVKDDQLQRIAGFIHHTLSNQLIQEQTGTSTAGIRPIDWIDDDDTDTDTDTDNSNNQNRYRPYNELHAYMPGLGPTQPFYDPSTISLCTRLQEKYENIQQEYQALIQNEYIQNQFQSVTDMNYDSGWQTLILFYNGQRIPNFPYHLCPVTTKIMESVPLAGRIAGFNRQQPLSGIPKHTDGNNMWLTCQMGIVVPNPVQHDTTSDTSTTATTTPTTTTVPSRAYIRVGNETRVWEQGQCLVYDTTYQHETYNPHPTQERVVLHIDFYNTLVMTKIEIDILQYIYQLREQFLKAEGNVKVGAKIL